MDSDKPNNNRKIIASFVAVLAIVIVAVGISFANRKDADTSNTSASTADTSTTPAASDTNTTASSKKSGSYKDGEYTAEGSYMTPGGQEKVGVTVTLKDDVVTETTLQQHANNEDTENYQSQFASAYKEKVVGKTLDSIKLSRVSGSSLTSQGFNDALETIKNQAKEQS